MENIKNQNKPDITLEYDERDTRTERFLTARDRDFNFDLLQNKRFVLTHTIVGADAATAANYGVFFIAPFPCFVLSVREVHQTAGSDGSAVTLNVEKLTGTEAPGSGDELLSTALSLKATANTVQEGTLTQDFSLRNLATGDRLALEDTGTLTAVNNITVTIEIRQN